MKKFKIQFLESASLFKPEGYLEACLEAGEIIGDEIIFSDEQFSYLRKKFNTKSASTNDKRSNNCGCCGGPSSAPFAT